ncbi:MAG TPA: hypothetical protein VF710_04365 [Longimicrobium sp.]
MFEGSYTEAATTTSADPPGRGQDGGGVHVAGQHVAARVGLRVARERLPCFHFGADVGILPAFGAFTGAATVAPLPGDRVFVVAGDEVLRGA